MPKIIVTVPEGKYCMGCPYYAVVNSILGEWKCQIFKDNLTVLNNGGFKKCPACLKAIQQYKDEHDYDKAFEKLMKYLEKNIAWDLSTRRKEAVGILKALGYKEE